MRPFLFLAGLVVAVAAFASPYLSSLAADLGAGGFPKVGTYTMVTERFGERKTSEMRLDASTRASFEALVAGKDGANCRDRHVSIGGGTFSASITCDAPDGDIHNIVMERHGTYSTTSLSMVSTTKLWGMPMVETSTLRLREPS